MELYQEIQLVTLNILIYVRVVPNEVALHLADTIEKYPVAEDFLPQVHSPSPLRVLCTIKAEGLTL